jgi:hypothetical protein
MTKSSTSPTLPTIFLANALRVAALCVANARPTASVRPKRAVNVSTDADASASDDNDDDDDGCITETSSSSFACISFSEFIRSIPFHSRGFVSLYSLFSSIFLPLSISTTTTTILTTL